MSQILIKYSNTASIPMSLGVGELAYSEVARKLFIGTQVNGVDSVVEIGGQDLVERFGVVEADVAQLKIDVDAAEADIQTLIGTVLAAGGLVERVDDHESRIAGLESQLGSGTGPATFQNGVTINGNLVVTGTTTTVDSENVLVKDPVIHLGEGTSHADGMDRGVSFSHFDSASGSVKTGFFGMDGGSGNFKFIKDADVNGNSFSGEKATLVANVEGSATSLAVARNIDLGGEVTGTAAFDGSSDIQIQVNVTGAQSDAIAESLVRRDVNGSAKFNAIETVTVANMLGGADFQGAYLHNAIINGGTF